MTEQDHLIRLRRWRSKVGQAGTLLARAEQHRARFVDIGPGSELEAEAEVCRDMAYKLELEAFEVLESVVTPHRPMEPVSESRLMETLEVEHAAVPPGVVSATQILAARDELAAAYETDVTVEQVRERMGKVFPQEVLPVSFPHTEGAARAMDGPAEARPGFTFEGESIPMPPPNEDYPE